MIAINGPPSATDGAESHIGHLPVPLCGRAGLPLWKIRIGQQMRRIWFSRMSRRLTCDVLLALAASAAVAASAQPLSRLPQTERADKHAHGGEPATRMLSGTAFFVDGIGHMLTARHAVEGCTKVVVAKERWRITARVVAASSRFDLALIKAPKTLGLSAVFPRNATASLNEMVFASSYESLAGLVSMGGLMANARVTSSFGGSESGHLVMESSAGFGTSGAPVLDKSGLVQGVVSRRTMVNRVLAVNATEAKSFLAANGIRVDQDDRPQMAPSGSRAHRAGSLSARVTCVID